MKLHTMIEMYLKYDNMQTIGLFNAFICINNHVIPIQNACYHIPCLGVNLISINENFHLFRTYYGIILNMS